MVEIPEQAVKVFMDSFWGDASVFVEPSHVKDALTAAAPYMTGSAREQALEEEEFAIDKLRYRAIHTNSDADRQAYFDAVSKWFQHRHYRRMDAERALKSQPVQTGADRHD